MTSISKVEYVSDRGHRLMAQTPGEKPILTVEDCTEWVTLYLLMPDGEVKTVGSDVMYEVACRVGGWYDNSWDGGFYEGMARHLNAIQHERSKEVIVGRWYIEVLD